MGDQQPSYLEEKVRTLAKNAIFGDGYLWRHPECRNYKVIYTSTTPELLDIKRAMAPEIFTTGVKTYETVSHKGRYPNGKRMYRLASLVHPIFTEYAEKQKHAVFQELTLTDFGLWYLDDGTCYRRSDSNSYRFMISIGDCCSTKERLELFKAQLHVLFGDNNGSIKPNNSKATDNNKSWFPTKIVATKILNEAAKYGVLAHKFPQG